MSAQTAISWCDSTFNPWIGCTKVSPACDHCYAERDTKRFGRVEWGAGKLRARTSAANWKQPERWNRQQFVECGCGYRGTLDQLTTNAVHGCNLKFRPARRRVFCASLADWLDSDVPDEWLADLLDLIRWTPNIDWLLLTKRIGNWRTRLLAATRATDPGNSGRLNWITDWLDGRPPANVWIGGTVVNQDEADRDVPKLLRVPARVRYLSVEPMLGPISFAGMSASERINDGRNPLSVLHWIICGGESGPHARLMHPSWVRSLRDQCAAGGVPFHFKQWGEWAPNYLTEGGQRIESTMWMDRMGKRVAGRALDDAEHNEFPALA